MINAVGDASAAFDNLAISDFCDGLPVQGAWADEADALQNRIDVLQLNELKIDGPDNICGRSDVVDRSLSASSGFSGFSDDSDVTLMATDSEQPAQDFDSSQFSIYYRVRDTLVHESKIVGIKKYSDVLRTGLKVNDLTEVQAESALVDSAKVDLPVSFNCKVQSSADWHSWMNVVNGIGGPYYPAAHAPAIPEEQIIPGYFEINIDTKLNLSQWRNRPCVCHSGLSGSAKIKKMLKIRDDVSNYYTYRVSYQPQSPRMTGVTYVSIGVKRITLMHIQRNGRFVLNAREVFGESVITCPNYIVLKMTVGDCVYSFIASKHELEFECSIKYGNVLTSGRICTKFYYITDNFDIKAFAYEFCIEKLATLPGNN